MPDDGEHDRGLVLVWLVPTVLTVIFCWIMDWY